MCLLHGHPSSAAGMGGGCGHDASQGPGPGPTSLITVVRRASCCTAEQQMSLVPANASHQWRHGTARTRKQVGCCRPPPPLHAQCPHAPTFGSLRLRNSHSTSAMYLLSSSRMCSSVMGSPEVCTHACVVGVGVRLGVGVEVRCGAIGCRSLAACARTVHHNAVHRRMRTLLPGPSGAIGSCLQAAERAPILPCLPTKHTPRPTTTQTRGSYAYQAPPPLPPTRSGAHTPARPLLTIFAPTALRHSNSVKVE